MFRLNIHLFDIIYYYNNGPYVSEPISIATIHQKIS